MTKLTRLGLGRNYFIQLVARQFTMICSNIWNKEKFYLKLSF